MLRDLAGDGPNRWNFSFSGLKTAVLRAVRQSTDLDADRADLARGFQDAALEVLVEKTAAAAEELGYPHRDDRRRRGLQPRPGRSGSASGSARGCAWPSRRHGSTPTTPP